MTEGFSLIFSVHNREVMLFLEDEEGVYIFCCLCAKGGGCKFECNHSYMPLKFQAKANFS